MEMEQSTGDTPFYSDFGQFKEGYNREEAEAGINDAFHKRQLLRQELYLKELMLGSGLGHAAERTVHGRLYQPQAALQTTTDVAATTVAAERGDVESAANACATQSDMALLDTSPSSVMKQFTKVEVEVQSLKEVHQQLDDNMRIAEDSIAQGCKPHTFDAVLESLSIVLTILEEGDARTQVRLPMQEESAVPLQGAEAVMRYAQQYITPLALTLVNTLYATEWMLQYTMTFINSLVAKDEEEAQLRMELLARCVRWLGKIDQFVAFAFAFELKWQAYETFSTLRDSAERFIGGLIRSVEKDMANVLLVSFPKRRKQLLLLEAGIRERLQRIISFLHQIETEWMPDMKVQMDWKDEFLSQIMEKIHTVIAPAFLSASLGFIDDSLYKLVAGKSRLGFRSANSSIRSGGSRRSLPPRALPNVSVATQVEDGRVEEKLSFQQIGMTVKRSASLVVGLQLCMGARYVLQQCGVEHDERWGFSLGESPDAPNAIRDAAEDVVRLRESIQQRVRERTEQQAEALRVFFLT
ncbi:hypothetical protein DQ04_01831050 [Trypanosoma grayi]|uniref:hypothetical protein n=1 Tax=Trypanosoma grayi TaxID=71804 RepID=UPI0004F49BBC|nr:hypothetical protein DQ04_01831050 [Trypanosoma grayi]KEG12287.1 hypothetical protein DQ04_01831050 [Trypanosoma grayi]